VAEGMEMEAAERVDEEVHGSLVLPKKEVAG
jgi:hypothetical protein